MVSHIRNNNNKNKKKKNNRKRNKKIYVKERYLPIRVVKINAQLYDTDVATDYYRKKLSLLLPNVYFSFNCGL